METNVACPPIQLEKLFIEARRWKADLDFYHKESRFLRDLASSYFLTILHHEKSSDVRKMTFDLKEMEHKRTIIALSIDKHLVHLEDHISRPRSLNPQTVHEEHLSIKERLDVYIREGRFVKEEIFTLLKHAKKSEQAEHLLDS